MNLQGECFETFLGIGFNPVFQLFYPSHEVVYHPLLSRYLFLIVSLDNVNGEVSRISFSCFKPGSVDGRICLQYCIYLQSYAEDPSSHL